MPLNFERTRDRLKAFDFRKLFIEELGWDRPAASVSIAVDGEPLALQAIAQKRGVQVLQCPPDADGRIPDYDHRRKIEKEVAKAAFEHLLIFTDTAKTTQIWQWVAREPGNPAAYREVSWHKHQQPDALVQKLERIAIPLSEEEAIDLTGTITKLRDAFDRDKLTKKFFDHFKSEHKAFLEFIEGITDQADLSQMNASGNTNRLCCDRLPPRQAACNEFRARLMSRPWSNNHPTTAPSVFRPRKR